MTIVPATQDSCSDRCLRIGLVNNMPDSALAGTERQFLSLLDLAAQDIPLQVSFFSLPGISRGDAGRHHLQSNNYGSLAELRQSSLDAVIVTGTEPHAPLLEDEPFWEPMTELFDWVAHEGVAAIFSCLAAHAAVLHFDGISRRRLPQKRFGMFVHGKASRHALTSLLGPTMRVAHSRWNEIAAEPLTEHAYRILTQAPAAGVDLFVRDGLSNCLFFQGHPEYDPGALGREFYRDVKRYLAGERDFYPDFPVDYYNAAETRLLTRFRARALAQRDVALMTDFPVAATNHAAEHNSPAAIVLHNWLQQLARPVSVLRSRNSAQTAIGAP